MNREEFVREFAERQGITIREAREMCYGVFDFLGEKIMSEDRVYIIGLGTFKKQHMKPKRILNVNTGTYSMTRDMDKVVFHASDNIGIRHLEAEDAE